MTSTEWSQVSAESTNSLVKHRQRFPKGERVMYWCSDALPVTPLALRADTRAEFCNWWRLMATNAHIIILLVILRKRDNRLIQWIMQWDYLNGTQWLQSFRCQSSTVSSVSSVPTMWQRYLSQQKPITIITLRPSAQCLPRPEVPIEYQLWDHTLLLSSILWPKHNFLNK